MTTSRRSFIGRVLGAGAAVALLPRESEVKKSEKEKPTKSSRAAEPHEWLECKMGGEKFYIPKW
jgi:hypothetical protein